MTLSGCCTGAIDMADAADATANEKTTATSLIMMRPLSISLRSASVVDLDQFSPRLPPATGLGMPRSLAKRSGSYYPAAADVSIR